VLSLKLIQVCDKQKQKQINNMVSIYVYIINEILLIIINNYRIHWYQLIQKFIYELILV